MKKSSKPGPTYGVALRALLIFVALVLSFTIIGTVTGPPEALVGGTRPELTIPAHAAELAGFGVLLGGVATITYVKKGLPLVLLSAAAIVLLDLDHLPAYIGIAQPIRPAHSLVFVVVSVAVTAIVIRRLDVDLVILSAVLGHLGVDTGLFAPFSPLSYTYYQLDPYSTPFLAGALAAALAAGCLPFLRNRRRVGAG